ncbi:CDP-alcohol phosphatidyltransferase family protein [Patescibacteria group bacterium]|nr:CDP-alcohol phosphatidyltransferase family protein [Patescibacteria group bacterium]MBU1029187.1 CDP-alcohol phosphatidyltransferase family protein [Patescibacteria group bacterium]MBU1915599.1 CDP-alcohol phosphatidyltransferase family protein [Patescibacteria group bacterium]
MTNEQWNEKISLYPHDHIYKRILDPLIPAWIKPNHITVVRMLLIPPVLFFLNTGDYRIGMPLFLFAALTDALDGAMARVRKQITTWGIIYDPLADKLLIGSVIFLIVLQHVNFFLGMALLVVEALMIVGAWLGQRRGDIRPANLWGKIKMVTEVAAISLLLLALWLDINLLVSISAGTLAVALAVAIVSVLSRLHV